MADSKKIILTGGGTAGHVIPHLAILPLLKQQQWQVVYVGSNGIEKELMADQGVAFREIPTGKLRRYFSWQNFTDLFRIVAGLWRSLSIMVREKPQVVFSKGGFVSVPVCVAARLLGIPVVTHEADLTPGLATNLIKPFASRVLYTFPVTAKYFPAARSECVGLPIRQELLQGSRTQGLNLCGFTNTPELPVLLVMGGSLGAKRLNDCLLEALPELVQTFRVIHITGRGKQIPFSHGNYKSFEYVKDEIRHIFACTDLVISRSGANSIFEFLALRKPMVLVPLEVGSRGDQVHNAQFFAEMGWAICLREVGLTAASLKGAIQDLDKHQSLFREKMAQAQFDFAGKKIVDVLVATAHA